MSKKDPNFPHAGEGQRGGEGANPPPMSDQLPQEADAASVEGMRREGRLGTKGDQPAPKTLAGHTEGTVEYEEALAAQDAEPVSQPITAVEPPAKKGKWLAVGRLTYSDKDGNRVSVADGDAFDGTEADLEKEGFKKDLHYKANKAHR